MESIGSMVRSIDSQWYSLILKDERGMEVPIKAVGIDVISSSVNHIKVDEIDKIFPWIDVNRVKCPIKGQIDILIGFQYAAYHPTIIDNSEHLLLLENRFGFTIAGEYPEIQYGTVLHNVPNIDRFNLIENIGVTCQPQCRGCSCGKCHIGGKDMSIKDEREYRLIESKIEYQPEKRKWKASYPYIKDHLELPENRNIAYNLLKSTEKRLRKNEEHAKVYEGQIQDMIDREVARKVEEEELIKGQNITYLIMQS